MGGPARPENSQQQEAAKTNGKRRSSRDDKGGGPENTLRTLTRDTSKYKIGGILRMVLPAGAPPGHAGGQVSGTITIIEPIALHRHLDIFKASAPSGATAADAPSPGIITLRTGAGARASNFECKRRRGKEEDRRPAAASVAAAKAAPAAAAAAGHAPARCAVEMMMSTARGKGQSCAAPRRRAFPLPTTAHGKIALMPLGIPMGLRVSAQAQPHGRKCGREDETPAPKLQPGNPLPSPRKRL